MAGTYPFFWSAKVALAASGLGSLNYAAGTGEHYQVQKIFFVATGGFSIVGITNSGNRQFTNASITAGLPSTMFDLPNTNTQKIEDLVTPLDIQPQITLTITLLDTSAAPNTVTAVLQCSREEIV